MNKAANRAKVLLNSSVPFLEKTKNKKRLEIHLNTAVTSPKHFTFDPQSSTFAHVIQICSVCFGWNSPSKSNGQSSPHRRSHKSTESEYGHYGGPEECEHLGGDFSVVALSPCLINEVLYSLRENTQVKRINTIRHERKGCFNLKDNRNINKNRTPRHKLSSFIFQTILSRSVTNLR